MIYKFRAWDTQNEEFIDDDDFYIGSNGSVSVRDNYDDSVWHEGGPIILLMFTGLLDKNGVELYGGDKVKITLNEDYSNAQFNADEGSVFDAVIKMESYMWVFVIDEGDGIALADSEFHEMNIEKIGTIYD